MVGYELVYIGDTSKPPNYPAYSGNGSRLTIYLTPGQCAVAGFLEGHTRGLLRFQSEPDRLPVGVLTSRDATTFTDHLVASNLPMGMNR